MYVEKFTKKTKEQYNQRKIEENYCSLYRKILNELTKDELEKISKIFSKVEKSLKHKNWKYNRNHKWQIKYKALKASIDELRR